MLEILIKFKQILKIIFLSQNHWFHEFYLRKAIKLALSYSPAKPAKDILLPGTYFPGFNKYINKCFSDHTNPAPFKALLAGKLVLPVCLPITPPSLGPAEFLSSPYLLEIKVLQESGRQHNCLRRQLYREKHHRLVK